MSRKNIRRIAIVLFIAVFLIVMYFSMIMEKNYAVIIGGATFAVLVYIVVFVYLRKKKRADTT